MNKHRVCLQARPKTVAGVSPACLGALAPVASRYMHGEVGERRGLVVLTTRGLSKAPGPALQDPEC